MDLMDSQIVELLGRHVLINQLLDAELEVAQPVRDHGVDLIAYVDRGPKFAARPIQFKACRHQGFSIAEKYATFPDLLLAYVWNVEAHAKQETFAMSYQEAYGVAEEMGWTTTQSWQENHIYTTTAPGAKLCGLLERYSMTCDKWWQAVTRA